MHFQVILNTEFNNTLTTIKGGDNADGSVRYKTSIKGFDESVLYDVHPKFINVVMEVNDGIKTDYDGLVAFSSLNRDVPLSVLPEILSTICYLHNKQNIKIGGSRHSLVIHDPSIESRYDAKHERGRVILHEKEGVIFQRHSDFVLQVPTEVVASVFIETMGLSIRLFPETYLVRFSDDEGYHYYPMSEVYSDPIIRNLRWRPKGRIAKFDWEGKRKELEALVEAYTAPKQ